MAAGNNKNKQKQPKAAKKVGITRQMFELLDYNCFVVTNSFFY